VAGGAGGENVERRIPGLHLGGRGGVGGRLSLRHRGEVVDCDEVQIGQGGATGSDRFDQIGLRNQHGGFEQADAVGQDVLALMMVKHAGDRSTLDRGQHHQHRVG
jgi:hypothetical protein